MTAIEAVPYGSWEVPRRGSEVAILAVGTMVRAALEAAETLAVEVELESATPSFS